ncbi:ATP-dependent helicase [Micrococcales bacterium 31B]|nr:ATP-dependent helicase [Micrococcales bacterium 31B]
MTRPDATAGPPRLSAVEIAERLGLHPPTPQQQRIIEAGLEPLLVVAGAGSGKTETMSARVVYLVANGYVRPDEVLGLTFTRKAASELHERIAHRLQQLRRAGILRDAEPDGLDLLLGANQAHVSTYNAFAASIVRDHGVSVGLTGSRTLLREASAWQLRHDIVTGWRDDLNTTSAVSTIEEAVQGLAESCANHLLDLDSLDAALAEAHERLTTLPAAGRTKLLAPQVKALDTLTQRRRLLPLLREYERRKADDETMDFADQVTFAARIVRDAPEVVDELRARHRVVLLDEFQDTSHGQLELLRTLFGDGHATTAVGDPQQSIYGWRGASAAGLATFRRTFAAPARGADAAGGAPEPSAHLDRGTSAVRRPLTRQFDLSTSWRNDRAILRVANRIAEALREDSARADVDVSELEARPAAGEGRVEALYFDDADMEANYIADTLKALDDERVAAAHAEQPCAVTTMAVLVRKRAQMERIERALRERGLKVSMAGLKGLLHVPEVADLRAFLEVVSDPARGDSLMRLLSGPKYRIGIADLAVLGELSRDLARDENAAGAAGAPGANTAPPQSADPAGAAFVPDAVDHASIIDAIENLPLPEYRDRHGRPLSTAASDRLVELAESLHRIRALNALPLPDLVHRAVLELGVDVEARVSHADGGTRALADLLAFEREAEAFAREATYPRLGAFLSWLEAAEAQEEALERGSVDPPSPDAVSLLTVHAAKGLEWDLVVVPGLRDGGLPSTGRDKSDAWLSDVAAVPFFLRGDRDSLPHFAWDEFGDQGEARAAWDQFKVDMEEYNLREERRLAYVAFTRARSRLLLTMPRWHNETVTAPSRLSPFLLEVMSVEGVEVDPHLVEVSAWEDELASLELALAEAQAMVAPRGQADLKQTEVARLKQAIVDFKATGPTDNPLAAAVAAAQLPRPDTPLHDAARRQAYAVFDAIREVKAAGERAAGEQPGGRYLPNPDALASGLGPAARQRVAAWVHDADLLLAEMHSERNRGGQIEVVIPPHLSASDLVNWAARPQTFLRNLRRRVPSQPNPNARRGTRFHAALEERFHRAALLGHDDLHDAPDEFDALVDPSDISAYLATFERSRWATRTPSAVEEVFELPLAGLTIRGSIDAVFTDGPQVEIVDWKTGSPATTSAEKSAREMQLATYRLAWHYRSGTPLDQIRACFYYAADGSESWAQGLQDAEGLAEQITTWFDRGGAEGPAPGPARENIADQGTP